MTNNKITLKHKLAYGVGDLYGGGSFLIVGALFLIFLTDIVGLSGVKAGIIIMIGEVWDAISDPIMGYISDRTRSKYGRRRIYFLYGSIPIAVSFALLWLKVDIHSEALKFIYYILIYLLFSAVVTMVMVPYNSMPAEMTKDYKERSSLVGVRMAFSQVSALLGALLPMTIVKAFSNPAIGYFVMGIGFGVLYAIGFIVVFLGTYELGEYADTKHETVADILKNFVETTKNKALRIHIIMYLCAYVAMDVFNALLLYFLRDYLQKDSMYQILLGMVLFAEIGGLYFVARACSRIGNARTYRRHVGLWMVGIMVLGLLKPTVPNSVILIVVVMIGVGLSGGVMVPYNMLAFVIDADELMTRKRREGIYAGMMTFVRKIAQALALFSVGVMLDVFRYNGELMVQESYTVTGIRILFFVGPSLLLLVGILTSYKFKITPANHEIMIEEIERLKAGGEKKDVKVQCKKICESITGVPYESLWKSGK